MYVQSIHHRLDIKCPFESLLVCDEDYKGTPLVCSFPFHLEPGPKRTQNQEIKGRKFFERGSLQKVSDRERKIY